MKSKTSLDEIKAYGLDEKRLFRRIVFFLTFGYIIDAVIFFEAFACRQIWSVGFAVMKKIRFVLFLSAYSAKSIDY